MKPRRDMLRRNSALLAYNLPSIAIAPILLVIALLCAATAPVRANDDVIYTLYRDSPLDTRMRIHIATFDATDGGEYNRENCMHIRKLMQAQEGVTALFWCEPGHYRP